VAKLCSSIRNYSQIRCAQPACGCIESWEIPNGSQRYYEVLLVHALPRSSIDDEVLTPLLHVCLRQIYTGVLGPPAPHQVRCLRLTT
jgi:hypothetical protein